MKFKCSECNYESDNKHCVIKHIIKKKSCCVEGKIPILNIIESNFICEYCEKSYTLKSNLLCHLKTCKIKKLNKDEEIKSLKEKLEETNNKLAISEALNKKPTNTTIIGTQNNLIINLAPWNEPLLPENIEKYYKHAVKQIFLAVPTLIKILHFNEKLPENHNICIKNKINKLAKVYNGKEWETIDEDILIRTLIDDYEQTLDNYAEEKNPKYIEKMKTIKNNELEEKLYSDLSIEVKRVIHDRKHMINTTRKN